ncbi:MAG: Pvc16 family protein, partial [Methylobacter sp.]|nr:Pvc16 family protein [Methylobacter sp.]
MSSALAIAGVTAVLRDLLNDGLINHDATGTLGSTITVSAGPPDRVIPASGGTESSQLNLFMYHVTPNSGWRNEGLPSRDSSGNQRLSNAPLA